MIARTISEAARALGMHAIQFRSIAQLKDDLKALGFPILPAVRESRSPYPERRIQLTEQVKNHCSD